MDAFVGSNPTIYNWGASSGWGVQSYEYGSAGFEEAFATHFGNITLWEANSPQPTTCVNNATCYVISSGAPRPDTNIELSSYPFDTDNCVKTSAAPESRKVLSHMRFLWDVYDDHYDAEGDSYTANTTAHYAKHLSLLALYDNGTGPNDIDEIWNDSRTAVTEYDGRGSSSYFHNFNAATANDVGPLFAANCSPK